MLGNGPAGIAAAHSAARAGARVTLVGDGQIGGRAGWDSLVPSKVWLAAVEHARECASSGAGAGASVSVEPAHVLDSIRAVASGWAHHQREELRSAGVRLVTGVAHPEGAHRVRVTASVDGAEVTQQIDSDAVILAPGSVPVFPTGMKPDGRVVIAPRFASQLSEVPARVAVIGAGPTGAEFAHLFLRLGSQVVWLVDSYGVLPGMDPAAVTVLVDALTAAGLDLRLGSGATAVTGHDRGVSVSLDDGSSVSVDCAFVAVGRQPDFARLEEATTGAPGARTGQVDGYGRTATPGIYLVGDAAGRPMSANDAESLGCAAGRHAAGAATLPHRPEAMVHAVFTEPAVAQVGVVSDDSVELRSQRVARRDCLKPWLTDTHTDAEPDDGFLTLFCEAGSGRLTGGVAVGHGAPEALAPVAVAVAAGASVAALAAAGPAYPTVSELATLAARRLVGSLPVSEARSQT